MKFIIIPWTFVLSGWALILFSGCNEESDVVEAANISLVTETGYVYAGSIDEIKSKVLYVRPHLARSNIKITDVIFYETDERLVAEIQYTVQNGEVSNVVYSHKWENKSKRTGRSFSGDCITVTCDGAACCRVRLILGEPPTFSCSCPECTLTYKEVPC